MDSDSTKTVPLEAFEAYEQTWQHVELVTRLLLSAQIKLMRRAVTHDRTKLISPEREMFAQMTHRLNGLTYGSPEYKECLQEMLGQALGHHYSHNRHHPEFFPKAKPDENLSAHRDRLIRWKVNNWLSDAAITIDEKECQEIVDFLWVKEAESESRVNNMNLFDILEMFVDWTAATRRHADGDIYKSIEINAKRFSLSPQLVEILRNTVLWISDEFEGLENQKQI